MTDEIERAERAGKRRARVVTVAAAIFLLAFAVSQDGGRSLDLVKMLAWAGWAIVLLIILAGGGGWILSRGVRRLMNDDVTQDNRRRALGVGFWVALAAAAILFVIDRYKPFPAQEASRLILTFAIAAALLWFGHLERRAYAA
jgi:succinate dehydrogenase hydrophobic anchor subunit